MAAESGRVGVLLINLGSPDAPTPGAVRRYLKEFLSDRRVVELPKFLWQPILRGVVLTTRPRRSAANYVRIWDREADDSPLRVFTAGQAKALQGAFGPDVIVDFAMRYGNPSMEDRLHALAAAGCDRVLLAPLYPQYCAATTATALDEAFRIFSGWRKIPAIRTLPPYFAHPAYIDALARSVRRALPVEPEVLLLSFHGMPESTRRAGDPYYDQCQETARLLRAELGYDAESMPVAFQSRFGRARWLEPATEPMLRQLAAAGKRRVAVLTPGFAADCLETLEEIGIGARETFLAAGGTDFTLVSCLNDDLLSVEMLCNIIGEQLAGWKSTR
ncbi:MAG: ferrochelatase [Sphingomonadaceae bacterium]